jgi:cobalt-zinc-cadmium efflux system outer membrane protein
MIARPEVQEKAWVLAALGDDATVAGLLLLDGASAGVQAQRDPDWQVGPEISLPIPVFDVGQARKERATAQQIEARHELVQAKRRVIEDVRRAFGSLARCRENAARMHDELIPLQEERRTQASAMFAAGQTDVTALFLAEQDLRTAQAKAVEMDRQTALAAIDLQRAVGGAGPAADVHAAGSGTDGQAASVKK